MTHTSQGIKIMTFKHFQTAIASALFYYYVNLLWIKNPANFQLIIFVLAQIFCGWTQYLHVLIVCIIEDIIEEMHFAFKPRFILFCTSEQLLQLERIFGNKYCWVICTSYQLFSAKPQSYQQGVPQQLREFQAVWRVNIHYPYKSEKGGSLKPLKGPHHLENKFHI